MKLKFQESPLQVTFSEFEISQNQPLIREKVNKLLKKEVLVEYEHDMEKTDGIQRLVLNLKILNKYLEYKYLEYKYFKMQTLQTMLTFIQPNCYMTATDLKDAYYPVNIDGDDTLSLKFLFNSKLLSCPMV